MAKSRRPFHGFKSTKGFTMADFVEGGRQLPLAFAPRNHGAASGVRIHRGEAFARVMMMGAAKGLSGTYMTVLTLVASKLCGFQDLNTGMLTTSGIAAIAGCSLSSVQHAIARCVELEILTAKKEGGEYRTLRIHPTLWSPPANCAAGSPNPFFMPSAQNPAPKGPPPFPPTTPLPSPASRDTGPPSPATTCGVRFDSAGPPPTAAAARLAFSGSPACRPEINGPATAPGPHGLKAACRRILRRAFGWNEDGDGAPNTPGTARHDVPEGRPAEPGSAPGPLEGSP